MPVNKVPIIHKFGIISPSHRLELQERLAKKTQLLKAKNERLIKASKNPLDVTEDFVLAYNTTHDPKRREKLDDKAGKILEKLKRQVGLKTGGIGNHVDIPIAWTELTQLSQCKGRVQQECLDILLVSLDQSPTSGENIPVLFFLAESVLYSLRTDVIYEQFLGSSEVKLLLIGQRVFARLFFHHMCGQMMEFADLKSRLHTYLDGFLDSQKVYKPYPHILSCLRYMSAVGSIIIGDAGQEQEDEASRQTTSIGPIKELLIGTDIDLREKPLEWDANPLQPSASRASAALSSSVHELAPTLWHSLDVWRCVCSLGGGLSQALSTMQDCAVDVAMENWVDVICALDVLGDAAKSNLETLTALQHIACGNRYEQSLTSRGDTDTVQRDIMTDLEPTTVSDSRYLARLPAIAESELSMKNKEGLVQEVNYHKDLETMVHETERDWTNSRSLGGAFSSELDHSDQLETTFHEAEHDWTNSKSVGGDSERRGVTRFADKSEIRNFTDDFDSNSSSLLSNQMANDNAVMGLPSWRWELALKYIDVLGHIVLCGATSLIRRQALMGVNEVTDYIHQTASIVRSPLASAGLFDLLFFRTAAQENSGKDGVPRDWGWRVRFATFLSLYKIHACLSKDQTVLGIRTVIWNILEKAGQLERDVRVLEALKVAQVDANLESLLYDHLSVAVPSNLGAKIAQGLLSVYLPPLPSPTSGSRPQTMRQTHAVVTPKSEAPNEIGGRTQRSRQPLRTSLRDEIMLSNMLYQPPVSYEKRNNKRLNYVIEDQWRKELERQATIEQDAKLKELDEKEKRPREKNKNS